MVLDDVSRTRPIRKWRRSRWSGRCGGGVARGERFSARGATANPSSPASSVTNPGQAQFGIVQGGVFAAICARESARGTVAIGFEAYAIGGLSVGEPTTSCTTWSEQTTPCLPADGPAT